MFLSLILLLIMSFICTIIESARINTAKVYAQRAFTTALDSTLAGYYAPLWNEYHIFGLNTGSSDCKTNDEVLSRTVKNYMEYALHPGKDIAQTTSKKSVDILDLNIDEISVLKTSELMDYEGKLFQNQAVEYMKYAEIADGLELLLEKLSILEQSEKVSYIMEEKQRVEEELVEIDEELLKLMTLYDGLMTSRKGILLDKDGSLKTTQIFIKKICYADISMDSVGINNESLFNVQKEQYINPSDTFFTYIKNSFTAIYNAKKLISRIQEDITALEELIAVCEAELGMLSGQDKNTDEDNSAINSLNESINKYAENLYKLREQKAEQEELIKQEKTNIAADAMSLCQLLGGLLPLYNEAESSINKIMEKANLAAPLISGYENMLKGSRDGLSQELYEGLEEELNSLKKYTAADNSGYNFPLMLQILEDNKQVLSETIRLLQKAEDDLDREDYQAAESMYTAAENCLMNYRIEGLTLDYSTLVFDKDNQKEVLDKVNAAIAGGISSLVMDPDNVSQKKLSNTDYLPSFIHALTDTKSGYISKLASFFTNAKTDNTAYASGELFSQFRDETNIKDFLTEGLSRMAEMVLFMEYLNEHFCACQPGAMQSEAKKPSVLEYEQEYLIIGGYLDAENLNAVITRILLIRMIFDFITVLSDKSIRNEARLIATALVGFTGLHILVFLIQMLILLIWSFAEALLDTTALMMGKDVPILKKKAVMTFPEIFMLTREQLSCKAAMLSDTKELSFGYNDYLKIFLLMTGQEKLIYRAMDLIQENLKLRYNDYEFRMSNCLFGFEMSARFEIKRKFTSLGFIRKYFDSGQDSYQFSAVAADSY